MAEKKTTIYNDVKLILENARATAIRAVNFSMVIAYWKIGERIVEEEQSGKARAGYGEYLINNLAKQLTKDYGKGFDERELRKFRQFYSLFQIRDALRPESEIKSKLIQNKIDIKNKSDFASPILRQELSWTHFRMLIRVENSDARNYYMNEAADNNWSTRVLERQINSFYFERLLSSKNKKAVIDNANKISIKDKYSILDFVKDPYVLEFLKIDSNATLYEQQLETELLNKLQHFLLELGKGFSFVSRQKRITADGDHFYIDLVFCNYVLKCFVLIDLKTTKLTHQDIGQMDFYIRCYEDQIKQKEDNPTIGIILCSEKNETIAKYSVLNESKRIFASKYKLFLPSEKELVKELKTELEWYNKKKMN
jgi:predicted nuclease of restriction endonuclease-like (RecB) superfamily